MPDNYLDILRQANAISTVRPNSLIETVENGQQQVNWQMLASYLDSSIFEFILQNKDIPQVSAYGLKLAQELANNFNINR